jgi:hypothetical protein
MTQKTTITTSNPALTAYENNRMSKLFKREAITFVLLLVLLGLAVWLFLTILKEQQFGEF